MFTDLFLSVDCCVLPTILNCVYECVFCVVFVLCVYGECTICLGGVAGQTIYVLSGVNGFTGNE